MEMLESELVRPSADKADRRIVQVANNYVRKPLKERRHAEFFDVINASLEIRSPEQFCAWTQGDLQHIFPHEMLVCGIGLMDNLTANIQHLITSNFPTEYIQSLHDEGGLNSSPVLLEWIKQRRPVLYEPSDKHSNSTWLKNFQQYDLQNIAAHGQSEMNSHTTSYFSFSRVPGKLSSRHVNLLEMLVPHLHVALIRAIKGNKKTVRVPKAALPALTQREQEVLQWLGSGKTNWEIAQVLCISEHTVKNHVQRILIKLKVNTRAQAVGKALVLK
jgi:transcriptional regulator EpsA